MDFKAAFRQGPHGYLVLLGVLLAAGLGVPLPEDIPLVTAGFLIYTGQFTFVTTLLVSMVGVLGGDSMIFWAGRRAGKRGPGKRSLFGRVVGRENRQRVLRYFERYGKRTLFIARFLPGLRAPTYFTAGASNVSYLVFLAIDGLAAIVSVPVWIVLGWVFGPQVDHLIKRIQHTERLIFILLGVLAAIVVLKLLWRRLRSRRQASTPQVANPSAPSPDEKRG